MEKETKKEVTNNKEEKKSLVDIKALFDTDIDKEQNGVWVEIGGARFKVASLNIGTNLNYNKKYLETIQNKENLKSQDVIKEAMADIYAETILLDWEGVESDGVEFPYSVENAKELLKVPRFMAALLEEAVNIENYRKEKEEEIVKN